MRIGVMTDTLNNVDGGFHYEVVFLNALSELVEKFPAEFVCFSPPETNLLSLAATNGLKYRKLSIKHLGGPVITQGPPQLYLENVPPASNLDPASFQVDRDNARFLRNAGVELILQLGPFARPFAAMLPFIMSIYDLNHRLQPEFPEVSALGEFNRREYLYTNACRYATLILVDSQIGKEDVLEFYGAVIGEDRIRILPYYPPIERKPMPSASELERVARFYSLPAKFFFYPAQFWRHKNHASILRAVRLIADQTGEKIPIVFCGAYTDYFRAANFQDVVALVHQLGIADRISYLGPVPGEDIPALYMLSAGLVMPTFFGPTNIPPLEAWHYGRPVITSNIRGVREQNGDASLLIDPRSPVDLARAMLELWHNDSLAGELARRGKQRLAAYSWSAFVEGVGRVVTEACERVRTGQTPKFPDIDLTS